MKAPPPAARPAPRDRRRPARVTSHAECHRGRRGRVVHPGDNGRSLEQECELRVAGIERRRRAIENLDGLGEAMSAAEREPQHQGCFGCCAGIQRGVHGQLQVLGPVGEPSVRFGHSEVEQQCRPVAGGGGSASARPRKMASDSERPASPPRGRPRPAARRPSCRRPAHTRAGAGRRARARRPVRRAARRRGGGLARARRGRAPSRCRRERADARTSAAGRVRRFPRPPADRPPRLPRAPRDQRVALLGEGRFARVLRALVRADRHAPATVAAGGRPNDRRLHSASDASLAHRLHELAYEEWRPLRYAHAGLDDGRIRSRIELRLQELGDGGDGEGRETDHLGRGISRHDPSSSAPAAASRGRVAATRATSSSSSRVSRKAR